MLRPSEGEYGEIFGKYVLNTWGGEKREDNETKYVLKYSAFVCLTHRIGRGYAKDISISVPTTPLVQPANPTFLWATIQASF